MSCVQAAVSDEIQQTTDRLTKILEDRRGKYNFADIRVQLEDTHNRRSGAEAAVIVYRCVFAPEHCPHIIRLATAICSRQCMLTAMCTDADCCIQWSTSCEADPRSARVLLGLQRVGVMGFRAALQAQCVQ